MQKCLDNSEFLQTFCDGSLKNSPDNRKIPCISSYTAGCYPVNYRCTIENRLNINKWSSAIVLLINFKYSIS